MKIRTLLTLLACLLCLGTLVACKQNDPPAPQPETPPEEGGTTEEGKTEEKYVYDENEYFELLKVFGKWEDNFAPGGRTDTHTLTAQQLSNGL